MCCTRPRLNRCPDNTKLAYHRRVRNKLEWIYTQAKVRSPGNIELAREEKKTRRLRFFAFLMISLHSWFRHTRLFRWMVWGLIDRYFGIDYECESLKSQHFICSEFFVMYHIYGIFRPSLLIESTDSMILYCNIMDVSIIVFQWRVAIIDLWKSSIIKRTLFQPLLKMAGTAVIASWATKQIFLPCAQVQRS